MSLRILLRLPTPWCFVRRNPGKVCTVPVCCCGEGVFRGRIVEHVDQHVALDLPLRILRAHAIDVAVLAERRWHIRGGRKGNRACSLLDWCE